MSDSHFELHLVPDEPENNVIPQIFRVPPEEFQELWEAPSPAEVYRLALESIFRWTLRRDELTDAEIVRAIKKVSLVALEDV